ncbi:hypothetical protein A0H81_14925 [Grifola frondosa]|uniref:Protein kinase domain-containing protein n=1 Tax=Grifola frondosa TaxID=5627 RepID=A0A1C7LMD6_GRIFR|nr:hypothetical protein A0H81_14925 [Grifola frondosa]
MFQLSASTNQSATVINDREFATFYNVLRCYQEDAQQVKLNQSSSLKASTFMTSFIQPVFFSLRSEAPFQYKEQLSWEFPIFISFSEFPDSWWKYTPNSNFSVISLSHLCPFVVAEVISRQHEEARYRMLLQAVAASRAGRYLLKPRSQKRFFTVAICLTAELIAERYIVCPAESGSQVHIATQHFDLTNAHQAVVFLRELYNLATLINELARELDEGKTQKLKGIRQVASKMASLHTRRSSSSSPRTTGSASSSINERDETSEIEDEDDLGIFGSDEVRCVLDEMSYKAAWLAFGHPDKGYTGTKGYIAPEVGKGAFSPIRADLWSCGKVIEELCSRCQPSDARERLLAISNQLTHQDPKKRPTISEVLRSIRGSNSNRDGIDEAPILNFIWSNRYECLDGEDYLFSTFVYLMSVRSSRTLWLARNVFVLPDGTVQVREFKGELIAKRDSCDNNNTGGPGCRTPTVRRCMATPTRTA